MALVPCRECGKDISTQAKTCPHCGVAKPSKGQARGESVFKRDLLANVSPSKRAPILVLGIFFAFIGAFATLIGSGRSLSHSPALDRNDPTTDMQELCKDLVFADKKVRQARTLDERFAAEQDLAKVQAWLAAYPPEEVSRACLKRDIFSEPKAAPSGPGPVAPVAEAAEPAPTTPPPAGTPCLTSPLDAFETGRPYPAEEFVPLLGRVCPGAKLGTGDSIAVAWEGRGFELIVNRLRGERRMEVRFEITSIRGQ